MPSPTTPRPTPVRGLAVTLVLLALGACPAASARDFHVSPAGDDTSTGTSATRPWRTLDRAGRADLRPGDRILLRGGSVLPGTLRLTAEDAGTVRRPVVVGSYGRGRATIAAGDGAGVDVSDAGGVRISGIRVQGSGSATNQASGIQVVNRLRGGRRLAFIRVDHVTARGFGNAGILVAGDPPDASPSGFRDVRISDCVASDNQDFGVEVTAAYVESRSVYANRDVRVDRCRAHDNPGDPGLTTENSGSGIFVGQVDGASITHSVADHNGALCPAPGGGPVGIWTASARRVLIEHDLAYANHTGSGGRDGGGFDLDGGVSDSVMQFNVSHDNAGAGYLVYNYGALRMPMAANTVRDNVSRDDSRGGAYAGIVVGGEGIPVRDLDVYNNSVSITPTPTAAPPALQVYRTEDARFLDNALSTAGGAPVVDIAPGQPGLQLLGNAYWAGGGALEIRDGGATYTSLAQWRAATGRERMGGRDTGLSAPPGPGLRGRGLDLRRLFGIAAGRRGAPADIGA